MGYPSSSLCTQQTLSLPRLMLRCLVPILIFIILMPMIVIGVEFELLLHRKDIACQPDGFGIEEFTGIRIQHQIIHGNYPIHHLRFSRCGTAGEHYGMDGFLPLRHNETGNYVVYPWKGKFCMHGPESEGGGTCYWLARTRDFAFQSVPFALPGTIMGAMYRCPDGTQDDGQPCFDSDKPHTMRPELVLFADDSYHVWTQHANDRHFVTRVPWAKAVAMPRPEFEDPMAFPNIHLGDRIDRITDTRSKMINMLDYNFINPMEDYTYSPKLLAARRKSDQKLMNQFPRWKQYFKALDLRIPDNYNTYMGQLCDSCVCSKVLQKYLHMGVGSIQQLSRLPHTVVIPEHEQQCFDKFPDAFNNLFVQLQSSPDRQTRHHIMPYKTSSFLKFTSIPYLMYRKFLYAAIEEYRYNKDFF